MSKQGVWLRLDTDTGQSIADFLRVAPIVLLTRPTSATDNGNALNRCYLHHKDIWNLSCDKIWHLSELLSEYLYCFMEITDMSKSTTKAQIVENVVAAIERANCAGHPNVTVEQNVFLKSKDNPQSERQLDVLVKVPLAGRVISIGLEVKDKSRPLSIEDVEQLIAKMNSIELDRRCIVSTSGYTKDAEKKAQLNNVELLKIEEIEKSSWYLNEIPIFFSSRILEHEFVELQYKTKAPSKIKAMNKSPEKVMLTSEAGEHSISALLNTLLKMLSTQQGFSEIPSNTPFSLTLELNKQHMRSVSWGKKKYPPPDGIRLGLIYKEESQQLSPSLFSTYQEGGEVLAAEFELAKNLFQLFVVSNENNEDGSRSLHVSISPSKPSRKYL